MPTILIIEDDELIASSLARALSVDHHVIRASTIAEAGPLLQDAELVLCDLGLPDGDGLDLIERIAAERPALPVVVLTARSEEADVVAGLTGGAIDYVVKPFRLAELQARIATHLRHAGSLRSTESEPEPMIVGDLEIDPSARRVSIAGDEVMLRPREFDLLVRLATDAGRVVRREDIMADVWDENWWGSTKTLDVHLNALRRKLGEEAGSVSRITAIRGVGYRLETGP